MQILYVFSLIFSLIIAVFAVMNSSVVTIKLFWVNYELSQSLVIFISAALGAVISLFLSLFSKIKSTMKIKELNNKIKNLENKIDEISTTNGSSSEHEVEPVNE